MSATEPIRNKHQVRELAAYYLTRINRKRKTPKRTKTWYNESKNRWEKMLITERHEEEINGTITCYDRIIIQGVIPNWSYAEGMTGYFYANNIMIFDFAKFSQPLTEKVRVNAEKIAKENGVEIEFIRKTQALRKDDRIVLYERS